MLHHEGRLGYNDDMSQLSFETQIEGTSALLCLQQSNTSQTVDGHSHIGFGRVCFYVYVAEKTISFQQTIDKRQIKKKRIPYFETEDV